MSGWGLEPYDVYHPDLKSKLFRDEIDENHWLGGEGAESSDQFFVNFVNYNYNKFSREYGCAVVIHHRRTVDARDIWLDDCHRALKKLHSSTEIDEFKTAGFLSYWLRRRCVINEVTLSGPRDLTAAPSDLQIEFIKFSNEICAFVLGFHFCVRFQARNEADARRIRLPHEFFRESAAFMNTKNVSPHSLYLIYRALFVELRR